MKPFFLLTPVILLIGAAVARATEQDALDIKPLRDLRGHRGAVKHLAFDPTGKLLISAGTEGRIRLWDLETGRLVRQIYPHGRTVNARANTVTSVRRIESIAFSPDGKTIGEVAMEPSLSTTLRLWNPEDGSEVKLLAEGVDNMRSLAFAPDGKLIATNMRDPVRWRHKIVLLDSASGKTVAEMNDDRLAATLLTFSPDGKLLASAGGRNIHIWDVATRKLLHTISSHEKAIQSICFSPNGKLLASGSTDDTIRIWDVAGGRLDREIDAEQNGVYAVAFSASGRTIISAGGDKTIKLWNPKSGKMRARLWGHLDRVLCLALSPDGKTLASGSRDTTIALWDISGPDSQKDDEDNGWGDD